jgi:replicative DNA helicase
MSKKYTESRSKQLIVKLLTQDYLQLLYLQARQDGFHQEAILTTTL